MQAGCARIRHLLYNYPMEEEHLSASVQDYLKAIYGLTRNGQSTSTSAVAKQLAFAPASVTHMLQKLASMDPPLLEYQKRQSVQLTRAGELIALRILRRHRLLETFLVQVLGYSWEEVHAEAELLEHAISARFEERMAQVMGEPAFDPHGDPIPDQDLILPVSEFTPLSQIPHGVPVQVRRVQTNDPELLQYFAMNGLRPGAAVMVIRRNPVDQLVIVRVEGIVGDFPLAVSLGNLIEVG